MLRRLALGLSFVALSTLASACGGEADSADGTGEDDFTSGKKIDQTTTSFAGTFNVDLEGDLVRMQFEMTHIEWDSRTAVFGSKIVAGQHDGLAEDRDVPVKIRIARCAGCYSFEVVQEGQTMLQIDFENGALERLEYSGFEGTRARVTEVTTGGPADGGVPEGYGAPCGGFAGYTCRQGLQCDDSRGLGTGFCR